MTDASDYMDSIAEHALVHRLLHAMNAPASAIMGYENVARRGTV